MLARFNAWAVDVSHDLFPDHWSLRTRVVSLGFLTGVLLLLAVLAGVLIYSVLAG